MPKKKKTDPDVFWMIRRKSDGLYATGASYIDFDKRGKMWKTENYLLSHLRLVNFEFQNGRLEKWNSEKGRWDIATEHPYADCEVVEVRRVPVATADVVGYGE